MPKTLGWTLEEWRNAYRGGQEPEQLLIPLLDSLAADDPAWIARANQSQLDMALSELAGVLRQAGGDLGSLPLYGVPFAVKDNIDAVGFQTTAACPAYAYCPEKDAPVVARLKAAGAVLIGKTNLDQFATGLVGTRSPYGAVPNTFDDRVISGGSSSGSASVVARGLVPFALGTDTAGSGRVPAGLNNLVGLKPTRGAISIEGVVPACRSLDCVSIFALTIDNAGAVFDLAAEPIANDPFSRVAPAGLADRPQSLRRTGDIRRLAVPASPQWFGDSVAQEAWHRALEEFEALGFDLIATDFSLLFELAALLYEGPWVAERHAAVGEFMADHGDRMNPVVRGIIQQAEKFTATDSFRAMYRKETLVKQIDHLLADVDGLLVPTAPIAPTLAQVDAEPVLVNSRMGTYTNFVNLADLAALAIPAGFRSDGLPVGVTLISGAWRDADLQRAAARYLNHHPTPLGATQRQRPSEVQSPVQPAPDTITVAVVGAHLSGMPLNSQLTERRGVCLEQTTTAPNYRLYALPGTTPPKPGLRRVAAQDGAAIIVELWRLPATLFGSFVELVPPPLGIGNVELADGRWVKGFICEGHALENAEDVSHFGGWRAFIEAPQSARR
ncbi:MAG: allophanate hydrolase [Oleiphilaceae bacterium]|nr:allophanate hydrolase [Oleiphilaceae bacterium]